MTDLFGQMLRLAEWAEGAVAQSALVFLRIGGIVALLPALGERVLPQRIKLAAALAMTAILTPAVSFGAHPLDTSALLVEAGLGFILGLGLRFLIFTLQTAGTLIAQSVSLAQMFSSTGPEPQPVVATLLTLAGAALFLAMDGLAQTVQLILISYQFLPVGQIPDAANLAEWGVERGAATLAAAFSLAAPFVLAALLYNLALGVINRAMPALMVVFIGAPALTLGGLAMLALIAPMVLRRWQTLLTDAITSPFGG